MNDIPLEAEHEILIVICIHFLKHKINSKIIHLFKIIKYQTLKLNFNQIPKYYVII